MCERERCFKSNASFISMENTSDAGSIMTPLNRASFQLKKHYFFHIVTIIVYAFHQQGKKACIPHLYMLQKRCFFFFFFKAAILKHINHQLCSHCFIFINIQQVSMNAKARNFFCIEVWKWHTSVLYSFMPNAIMPELPMMAY